MFRESHESDTHTPPFSNIQASGVFNSHAGNAPAYNRAKADLGHTAQLVDRTGSSMSLEQLGDIQKQIDALKHTVQTQKMGHLIAATKARMAGLHDDDASGFGKQFLDRMQDVDCKIHLDPHLRSLAVYTSYSYASHNRGFANEINLNPDRVNDEDAFVTSIAHEYIHAFQKNASPALHCSPFNPESRVVVHPEDWIMLEALCERDAYTKQAFLNSLLAKENSDVRGNSKNDIVTVDEFENIRSSSPSLADAMVSAALKSLQKPTHKKQPNGRTFVNNYQDVALQNYEAGMSMREQEHETDLVFVRLELPDLWQVGNYRVGPNSFGENIMEPLIERRFDLKPDAKERLDGIRQRFHIPPRDRCPTLRGYQASIHPSVQTPSQPALAFVPAFA